MKKSKGFLIKNGILIAYTGPGGHVIVPEGVVRIADFVFRNCTDLTEVTLPSSVTKIGWMAFSECPALTEIRVDTENSVYTSVDGVVFNKDQTTLSVYPCGRGGAYEIPTGVKRIMAGAFAYCASLTAVTIPDGVTKIERDTFFNCTALTHVDIPDSVTCIRESAFADCSGLADVTIPKSVKRIDEHAFGGCPFQPDQS